MPKAMLGMTPKATESWRKAKVETVVRLISTSSKKCMESKKGIRIKGWEAIDVTPAFP